MSNFLSPHQIKSWENWSVNAKSKLVNATLVQELIDTFSYLPIWRPVVNQAVGAVPTIMAFS